MSFKDAKHIQLDVDKTNDVDAGIYYSSYGEYAVNWKNIIFLPFNNSWKFFIMVIVVINTLTVLYDVVYTKKGNMAYFSHLDILFYMIEVIYLFDTAVSITHRNMKNHRKTREYDPKPIYHIIMDVITLIPIYEMYLLVKSGARNPHYNSNFRTATKIITFLRLYRVYDYFHKITYNSGINQMALAYLGQYIKLNILINFIAGVWYLRGCWRCKELNWTANMNDKFIDANNPLHWWVMCYSIIGNTFTHNFQGCLEGTTYSERAILSASMLIGFTIHFLVYFGQLTWDYVKIYRRQINFVQNLQNIKTFLKDLKIDKEWYHKTIDYYGVFWQKRRGIKDMPNMFQTLPIPLQKEVTLDIYWEALRHSHLFREEDISFKRALSSVMKCEFFLPEDYVYKVRKPKNKMVYIVHGIIQILTDEDEESPIISFSGGTILGELSCMMPHLSNTNVRCATYCEVHTLAYLDLIRILKNYPTKRTDLLNRLANRVQSSREISSFKQENRDLISDSYQTSIKWIKSQWHFINSKHTKRHEDFEQNKIDPGHTSVFLDMLVLCKEVELKMQVICLRGSCPFILEPNSSFLACCRAMVLIAVALQAIILPYVIAFHRRLSLLTFSFCFMLDFIYWFDIYLKLSTSVKVKHVLLSKSSSIILRQCTSFSFIMDVLASLPIDYIIYMQGNQEHVAAIFKLNRLIKMAAILNYITSLENNIWFSNLKAKCLKYVVIYVTTSYWYSCFSYGMTCFHKNCEEDGWFTIITKNAGLNMEDLSAFHSFLISFYFVFSKYLSVGIDHTDTVLIHDKFFEHACILLSYFVFTFWISSLTATFILHYEKHTSYRYYYVSMMRKLEGSQVPIRLKTQFQSMLQFWWYYNKNEEITGDTGILRDATEDLKSKLIKERIIRCLKSVQLFFICDDSMLEAIAEKCTLQILPPNAEVVTAHSRTTWLHIILRGYLYRESTLPGDIDFKRHIILKPGDIFPLFAVLYEILTMVTVTTVTTTELITINFGDIIEILQKDPETIRTLQKALALHLKYNQTMFFAQKGRLPEMIPEVHSLGQGDYFTYKTFECDDLTKSEMEYLQPWLKLGKWSCLRYLLMRNTINPEGNFFIGWECFNVTSTMVTIYLALTSFNLFIDYVHMILIFDIFGKILASIDFYIRAHCQYFDEQGILVTHPWYTLKRYINTSFLIDLIAVFPYNFFCLDGILGKGHRPTVEVILMVFARPLKLYRVLGFINYFQGNVQNTSSYLKILKYTIIVLTTIMAATSFMHITVCPIYLPQYYDPVTKTIACDKSSWINTLLEFTHIGKLTPARLHLLYLYTVTGIFGSVFPNTIQVAQQKELVVFIMLTTILFIVRWTVFCLTTTSQLGGNVSLTVYQEQIKSFLNFAEAEYLDDDLIKHTMEYYQYSWKKTQGGSINPTLKKFHPNLHAETVFSIYGPSMEMVEIFQGCDSGFFRQLGVLLQIVNFKKDADIIRINDVQGLLYIVYKGKVEVKVAGAKITTLANGAMFGCFSKRGITRHTLSITAKVHVELLSINSLKFHKAILKFPEVSLRLKEAMLLGYEFLESRQRINFAENEKILTETKVKSSGVKSTFYKLLEKCAVTINHDSNCYKIWEYFIFVHLPHFNSVLLMVYLITETIHEIHDITRTIIYITDLLVLIKIYVHFNLTFVDSESGLTINDHSIIYLNYIKSWRFWIDVCSTIPLELITSNFFNNPHVITYSMSNRLLRIMYLRQYHIKMQNKLHVKGHLRWTNLICAMFTTLEIMVCLWWLLACLNGVCTYLWEPLNGDPKVLTAEPGMESMLLAMKYVISLFTMTGMNESFPSTAHQIIGTIAIIIICLFTIIFLSSAFASLVGVGQYLMNNYEFEIRQLQMYLKGRELSNPLITKVWTYFLQLWTRQRGESLPAIITAAPNYLKQNLMTALYGHHLKSHFLFANTHVDFLRQLIVHLQRCLFFPGNFLVEKGDIDESMYFIHDGEVEVYEKHGNNVTFSALLTKGQSFGESQGLYIIPHTSSYKARTVVDALILKKSDWEYLLEWYPASEEELLNQANCNNLKTSSTVPT